VNVIYGDMQSLTREHAEYRNRLCGKNTGFLLLQKLSCCINYTSSCHCHFNEHTKISFT